MNDFIHHFASDHTRRPTPVLTRDYFGLTSEKDSRLTVLVIDDDRTARDMMQAAFEDFYRVLTAANGADGIHLAHTELPDLIILDVMMPDMNGHEVFDALRRDVLTREIPTIFLTSNTDETDERIGLEMGAVDYWAKPLNLDIARARTRNHLELKLQRDALARLAVTDGLTGLSNRRDFDERIDREWRRAIRSGTPLSLILLDVDHFKIYNDTFGHLSGDDCLKRIAKAIRDAVKRPADAAARFGGEEFACLLPETNARGAALLGDRLKQAITALNIPHPVPGSKGIVSVSLGVASAEDPSRTTPKAMITAADNALYDAKQQGRDRAVSRKLV